MTKWKVVEFADQYKLAKFLGSLTNHQQLSAKVSASDTLTGVSCYDGEADETKHYWHIFYPVED